MDGYEKPLTSYQNSKMNIFSLIANVFTPKFNRRAMYNKHKVEECIV